MPSCEMCGKELPTLRRATIEGTIMSVCGNCIKFGVEQAGAQHEVTGRSRATTGMDTRARRAVPRDVYAEMVEELAEDYGERVRKARTKSGMTLEELGEKLKTRRDTLAKVESGSYHPEEALITKLEREFGIKLKEKVEKPTSGVANPGTPKGGPVTLGDLIKQAQSDAKKK